jgi:type IV pilus assembly protein PilZ
VVSDDEAGETPENERRNSPRQPIELKVEYERLNTFFADYTKNISRGGTFIKTTRPLAIGTEFVFRLLIPTMERPLAIHGEVARIVDAAQSQSSGSEAGMAIRFVYRTGDSQSEISAVVESLMTESLGTRLATKLLSHLRARSE